MFPGDTPVYSGTVSSDTPIVIDNGSYHLRAGYASMDRPHLDIPNLAVRYRDRRLQQTFHLHRQRCHDRSTSKATRQVAI